MILRNIATASREKFKWANYAMTKQYKLSIKINTTEAQLNRC